MEDENKTEIIETVEKTPEELKFEVGEFRRDTTIALPNDVVDFEDADATSRYLDTVQYDSGLSLIQSILYGGHGAMYNGTLETAAAQVWIPKIADTILNPGAKKYSPKELKEMKIFEHAEEPMSIELATAYATLAESRQEAEAMPGQIFNNWKNEPVNALGAFIGAAALSMGPSALAIQWALTKSAGKAGFVAGVGVNAVRTSTLMAKFLSNASKAAKLKKAADAAKNAKAMQNMANAATLAGKAMSSQLTKNAVLAGSANALEEVAIHNQLTKIGEDYDVKTAAAMAFFMPAVLSSFGKAFSKSVEVTGIKKTASDLGVSFKRKLGKKEKFNKKDINTLKKIYKEKGMDFPEAAKYKEYFDEGLTGRNEVVKESTKDSPIEIKDNMTEQKKIDLEVIKDFKRHTVVEYVDMLKKAAKNDKKLADTEDFKAVLEEAETWKYLDELTGGEATPHLTQMGGSAEMAGFRSRAGDLFPFLKSRKELDQRLREIGMEPNKVKESAANEDILDKLFEVPADDLGRHMDEVRTVKNTEPKRDFEAGKGFEEKPKNFDEASKEDLDKASSSQDAIEEALGDQGKELNKALDGLVGCITGKAVGSDKK